MSSLRTPRIAADRKPGSQGSSVGMARVDQAADLSAAWRSAAFDPVVFAEPWITGAEYTVACCRIRPCPDTHRDRRGLSTTMRPSICAMTRATSAHRDWRPRRGSSARPGARNLSRPAARKAGGARFHDGPHRPAAAAGDQYRARHDLPQPGADGGARQRHRLRGAGLARARDQPRPPAARRPERPC